MSKGRAGLSDKGFSDQCPIVYRVSTAPAVVLVPLVSGREAVVDAADAPKILSHRWYLVNGRAMAFLKARDGTRIGIYMHRLVLGSGAGQFVAHLNGDGLDNRRQNLASRP